MEQKDIANACLQQAEHWYRLFDGRRSFEWKITIGFWVFIVGAINALPEYIKLDTIAFFGVIAILLHIFWLRGIWVANENDKRCMHHFQKEAEKILLNPEYEIKSAPEHITRNDWEYWFGYILDWSIIFQLATSMSLVGVMLVIIIFKPDF